MRADASLTDRLDLRPIAGGDLEALHRMRSNPRNSAYIPDGPPEDMHATSAWIERFGARWQAHGIGYWTARLRATGQVLGVGGVDRRPQFWNLYYLIDAELRGHGYATELARAAQQAAASLDPDLPLVAWIHTDNTASHAVARHLGLHDYGLREHDHWKGQPMHYWSDREPAS
jgi:RimJ/RimL family protein N-acetyltransferase